MEKKKNIRRKITELLLSMVLGVLLLIGGVSVFSLYSMRNISEQSSMKLGQTAAMDAEEALEKMAGEQLLGLAVQKTDYIEEKFNSVIACVNGIADEAETIYLNAEDYPDREVALPVKESKELAAQLLWSERLTDVWKNRSKWNAEKGLISEVRKLGNIQDLLVQYNKNNDMISSTYIATQSGWMIQADYISYSKFTADPDVADFYEADGRQWYQRALLTEEGKTVYSDVMEDIHEKRDCIVCSRPVYINGEIVAVAGVGSYLDTVNDAVLDTVIGEKGYAFLINEKGQVMVSGTDEGETAARADRNMSLLESQNEELAAAVEDMLKGGSDLTRLMLDDREVYMAYAPLTGLGWSFVTVMDVEEVIAPARQSQQGILELTDAVSGQQNASIRRTLLIFLVIIMLAAVLISISSIAFTRKLTDPIRKLTLEVTKMDGGNLDSQIDISTGDEVEELGKAFNKMTRQLKGYITNLAAATAEKERIRTELDLASQIQADMLPDSTHMLSGRKEFSLYARMTPAKEVGGDFYDFFMIDDDHLAFIVADVSGKGVPASLFMVVANTLLRTRIMGGGSLEDAVTKVNDSLCAVNKNGMFVTAWIGVLTISTGLLTYVNAGHNPPLIGNKKDGYRYIKERSGFVLAGMDGISYNQKQIKLEQDDTIFLYTDGVSEANDEAGKLYGEERLLDHLNDSKETEPDKLAEGVWEQVQEFQGNAEQFDDITMLAVNYHGSTEENNQPEEVSEINENVVPDETNEDVSDKTKTDVSELENECSENTGSADISRMQEVQTFLENCLQNANVAKRYIRQLLIVSDEIVSNICNYSNAEEVTVGCQVAGDEIMIFFEDDGIAFNPLQKEKPDVNEPLEQRKIGGLGIFMVCEMMDEVTYTNKKGKNRLTIIKSTK
ncbi:MAG: SpoIIE family protein phosphatase [Lachnospiraceae bacterium]|nr:SpoIIE family protein phosphatase [Lachnospiraceae bacterium]